MPKEVGRRIFLKTACVDIDKVAITEKGSTSIENATVRRDEGQCLYG